MTFDTLGLSAELLRAVADEGFTAPTPIQVQAIPLVLEGRDLMGAAQTGTGKTAAFVLPIFERLKPYANASFSPARHPVRALVLTPTRELAMQVAQMAAAYGRHIALRSAVVFGGVPLDPQIKELRAGVELLVATPGRLLDLVGQRATNLGQVEILVLDEGDRMLDMGFIPDIRRILELLPNRRQTLLFSATFSDEIRRLSREFLSDPAIVEVAARNATAAAVREVLYPVDREMKLDLLEHLVRTHDLRQVLVFTRTKVAARRTASDLDRHGFAATAIHSDRTQAERIRALADFKAGEVEILVATDVASRASHRDAHLLHGHKPNYSTSADRPGNGSPSPPSPRISSCLHPPSPRHPSSRGSPTPHPRPNPPPSAHPTQSHKPSAPSTAERRPAPPHTR